MNNSDDRATNHHEAETSRKAFSKYYRSREITKISRVLRKRPTKTEDLLWKVLRGRKLGGLKFRRQHPIGSSIVDFYCHGKRLVVEIDGAAHRGEDARERDKFRQEIIEQYGVRLVRLTTDEVENDQGAVLRRLLAAAKECQPLPAAVPPLPVCNVDKPWARGSYEVTGVR